MEDYLIKAWETLKKCSLNGVVFLLDEFHAIRDIKVNKWYVLTDLIGTFNTLQMKGYRYSLVLCGLPPMLRNVKESRSYSERMFTVMPISNLHENDAKNAILEPIRTIHRSFSDELVSAIVDDVDRYPYFIQFFSSEIIEKTDKSHLDLDDYNAVRDNILEKLGSDFFAQRMESLSGNQKKILYAMAAMPEEDANFSSICATAHLDKDPVTTHLKRLEEKGLIYKPQRGYYCFSMPLFQKYLDRIRFENDS